ncbi:glycosyltransferase family 2 protein [Chryseobacterium paridis]|uniref:Glycosyltransferase family 2 protein n=1 Tax=Chryseobacterium paridis TaxID=2800328 RepID=A0ABS1FQS6_9FLAO|nr:glycosyltransferase [Chryseobacterium paridis]MBK1894721.1 glycosyltransferase family 2 protein [Chryseobacterium paridis]
MKVSICIPVYNFDVRELISDLNKEIRECGHDAEIILIDDGSEIQYKQINKELQEQVNQFIYLDKNIGRSRIRNLFLDYSNGDYLLFLDCDGKITERQFIENYILFINENPDTKVIYAGRKVSHTPPDQEHFLRWKFAVERENLPVENRLEKPYLSFQTNNFLIKKEVFEKVQFNPDFQKYGYEDLLFAMDLKAKDITIDHIQNPIFNNDLETNKVYLGKVEESIESLAQMLKNISLNPKLSEIKLVKIYNLIHNNPLKLLIRLFFKFQKENIKKTLLKGKVNLRYLDYYKLGLLLQKME